MSVTSGETAGAGYGLDLAFGVARKGEWEFAMAMMETDPIPARAGGGVREAPSLR